MLTNRLWTGAIGWLGRAPIGDPVDRRNAPFVQVLLICMGLLMPVNKAIHMYSSRFRHSMTGSGLTMDVFTDVLMMVAAWISLYLIRRGLFRAAVRLYLGVMLSAAALAYAVIGLDRLTNDPFPLLLLGLGGLVLGRRSLWTVYVLLMGIFGIGMLADFLQHPANSSMDWSLGKKVSQAVSYFVVAVMLDRTVAALRDSLAESNARGRELEQSNARLESEMAERERAQGQLVHAQKMEAVGRLASGVAHDFDNVLNVVLGYAMRRERLADKGVPALVEALDGIELAARRALAISRKLLNFSRQDVLRPEVFDAAVAVRELQPMLRQLFAADTRLQVRADESGLWVRMDRGQFELAVMNMAANARDAMPAGGRFSVQAERSGDAVELVLADTGCGMSAEVQQHMYEPFYTTKPVGAGTGLGLAVVRDMVQAADGTISVESVPGQGCSFRIRLPRVAR